MSEPDIFLSYNREDANTARQFVAGFEAAELNVWWDAELRSGQNFDKVTEAALRAAKAVIVLWSKRSVESHWVRSEATIAQRLGTLKPVMIETCDRPIMFELVQTTDLMNWRGDHSDPVWQRFVDDIRISIGKLQGSHQPATNGRDSQDTRSFLGTNTGKIDALARDRGPSSSPGGETKLAVLPFDNVSADPDMSYFSDGISEEILAVVTRGSDIPTIGKLSSFAYRGDAKARAPSELKVTHILDGSVRKLGDHVRITAHLLDAVEDRTLWSETFDAGVSDLLGTQVTIAESIAVQLQSRFAYQDRGEIDPDIYQLFLRASDMSGNRYSGETTLAMFERVTREAPNFSPGWGRLASENAVYRMESTIDHWPRLISDAKTAILRTRTLDPAEYWALAAEYQLLEPYGDAERQASILSTMRSQYSNSGQFHFFDGWHLVGIGRMDAACDAAARGRTLDPENVIVSSFYGTCLYFAGRLEEARDVLVTDYARNPNDHHALSTLINCAAFLGDGELIDRLLVPDSSGESPLRDYVFQETIVRHELNRTVAKDAEIAAVLLDQIRSTESFDLISSIYVARYASPQTLFDTISELKIGSGGTDPRASDFVANTPMLLFMKCFPEVRQDPRFATLCARLGLAQFWIAHQIWPDCADEEDWGYDFRKEVHKAAETTPVDPPVMAI